MSCVITQEPVDELAALLRLSADGCAISFRSLYVHTSKRLFGTILRINSNQAEAEEVLQETYVKVWYQCRQFDPSRGQVTHWLTSIARHGAIDSLKRKQARPQQAMHAATDESDESDPFDVIASPDAGPMEQLIWQQHATMVRRWLGALPPLQRQSLALAIYGGLSHREVALQMDQPLGTVKTWVRRSLMSLKESAEFTR